MSEAKDILKLSGRELDIELAKLFGFKPDYLSRPPYEWEHLPQFSSNLEDTKQLLYRIELAVLRDMTWTVTGSTHTSTALIIHEWKHYRGSAEPDEEALALCRAIASFKLGLEDK